MPESVKRRGSSGPTIGATDRSVASWRSLSSTAMERRLRRQRGGERRDHGFGAIGQLTPGDSDHPVAPGAQVLVLAAIALERTARRMEGVAVNSAIRRGSRQR